MIVHTGRLLLSVVLPIKLTNNNAGRGNSFWKSAKDRKDIEALLRILGHVRTPFKAPVELRVTRLMGTREREWDYDSGLRGSFKEISDSCVVCGWFADDSSKYIRGVTFAQRKNESGKSETLIEIFEV